jgi:UPF0755 protein
MGLLRLIVWLVNLVLLAIFAAVVIGGIGAYSYFKPGPLGEPKTVIIERGMGLPDIADLLVEQGIIAAPAKVFVLGALATGQRGKLKAGEYELEPHMSMASIAGKMAAGEVVVHKVTVVDGMTVYAVRQVLQAETALTGEMNRAVKEGSLLPETYFYNRGDTRVELLARMEKASREALEKAWAGRAPNLPLNSPEEALVLASIIEKETGVAAERAKVAGVFINRLRKGMKLQSDPTAIYPLSKFTGDLGRALTFKDLELASPYNTYYAAGLPPGPICNPSTASIEAAVNPESHDYYYFVADGTGGHAFARTLDEHNRNVARWRQINKNR